ncbi:hypothetical protein L6164_000666 [Bauhinia variegata]|uniref:Uncharacterized protein n=1 Tax=Bauhinia variegata TaxID=167791 RepID=A0ACB9Q7B8_BAUVA|nr:hypothetical protein L6164_000666 [Bauhinia variegata]
MADSSPFIKPHFTFSELNSSNRRKPIKQGSTFPNLLFKSVFFAVFIIVLPLFPSQAPEIINQTIFTKFWELVYLLFIGIAVAYGLFSRRYVEPDIETHPSVDSRPPYVSKMFPVSTIFGDEYENPFGSDEKTMTHCWNSQYFEGESGVVPSSGGAVRDEQYQTQLPVSEGDLHDSVGYDRVNVVQASNWEYYHSEPVVIVAQPYYTIEERGQIAGYKPLGLPVRSLRSIERKLDSPRYGNESDSSPGSKGSSKSANREFGHLGHSNLEQKSNNVAGSSSPIPWYSRSRSVKSEEKHENRNFQEKFVEKEKTSYGSLDNMNFQEEDLGNEETPYGYSLENMNLQEKDMGENEISYGYSPEAMSFRKEVMGRKKSSYGFSSEMNFHEGDLEERKTTCPRRIASKEDMGKKETSYGYTLENMNSQAEDMGGDEITIGYSSENMNFREKVMGRKKSFHGLSSEMKFHEGDMERKKTTRPCLPRHGRIASKEDMGKKQTSYGYSSENMNLQAEDMGENEISRRFSQENMNIREEMMGKKKSSSGSSSEMNFHEGEIGKKKTSRGYLPRSERIASEEKTGTVDCPSHFRPRSVDETQSESLNSWSLDSVSSQNMNLQKEELGEKKSSHGSSSSSPSPPARMKGETTLEAFHSRGYSIGSLLQHDMRRNLKDDLEEKKSSHDSSSSSSPSPPARRNGETSTEAYHFRGYSIGSFQHDMKRNLKDDLKDLNGMIRGKDSLGSEESGMDSLHSDPERPASVTKAPSKGKSVRTRRASGLTSETMREGEICKEQTDEKMKKASDNEGAVLNLLMRKDKMKNGGSDHLLKGTRTKNLHPPSPKLETTFSSYQERQKHELSKNVPKEDLDIDFENIQVSADDDVVSEFVNDSGLDSEVDKKASEFIAKFKAQIRLQKMASTERSRKPRTGGNYIR